MASRQRSRRRIVTREDEYRLFIGLPRDLRELKPGLREAFVRYLSRKTLADLRRRQAINRSQTRFAFARHNDLALSNLQIMMEILAAAVMRREFPEQSDACNATGCGR